MKAIAKIGDALGMVPVNTEAAATDDQTDAALRCEQDRYARERLDLAQEFTPREDKIRAFHLRRVREICDC